MSAGAVPPAIEISNHQEMAVDLELLVEVANKALPLCIARAAEGGGVLLNLDEVEVSIVSDEAIAAVHAEFLDDPTPTDVITFDHGEILVSAETAAARAPEFGHSTDRELALYVVHGLLHLAGYGDKSEGEFERMRQMQEEVLTSVW
jgi:probable rRNA maturation factor